MLFGTSDVSVAIRTFIKEPTERAREIENQKNYYIQNDAKLLS
jgi:hypothetical protein